MKKQNNKKVTTSGTGEIRNLFVLILIILIILAAVYVVTKVFEKKDYSNIFNNSLETTEIQYKEIIVGTLFQQGNDEYYVLVIDDQDPYASVFEGYVETYQEEDHKIKMYTIDLNNMFNKNAKAEKSDYHKDQLKFRGMTLLRIKNKEIVEHLEDVEKINERLLELNE